jgi:hypothetical protein
VEGGGRGSSPREDPNRLPPASDRESLAERGFRPALVGLFGDEKEFAFEAVELRLVRASLDLHYLSERFLHGREPLLDPARRRKARLDGDSEQKREPKPGVELDAVMGPPTDNGLPEMGGCPSL